MTTNTALPWSIWKVRREWAKWLMASMPFNCCSSDNKRGITQTRSSIKPKILSSQLNDQIQSTLAITTQYQSWMNGRAYKNWMNNLALKRVAVLLCKTQTWSGNRRIRFRKSSTCLQYSPETADSNNVTPVSCKWTFRQQNSRTITRSRSSQLRWCERGKVNKVRKKACLRKWWN